MLKEGGRIQHPRVNIWNPTKMAKSEKQRVCEKHKKDLEIFCISEGILVCSSCVKKRCDPQDHVHREFRSLVEKQRTVIGELKNSFDTIDDKFMELVSSFEQTERAKVKRIFSASIHQLEEVSDQVMEAVSSKIRQYRDTQREILLGLKKDTDKFESADEFELVEDRLHMKTITQKIIESRENILDIEEGKLLGKTFFLEHGLPVLPEFSVEKFVAEEPLQILDIKKWRDIQESFGEWNKALHDDIDTWITAEELTQALEDCWTQLLRTQRLELRESEYGFHSP
mmetsp:Transcript_56421/g.64423  ORF Transcript_56421/g.64423 Transcript_56421/m.64423 type:complete len:284 (+) Transcript_56421:249-1100(+)